MLKRTPKEIEARIKSVAPQDFFGTQFNDLLGQLPYSHAKPYLKPETTEALWSEHQEKRRPRELAVDYLEFAWGKANNCRGLSAGRSLDHLKTYMWLDGFDGLDEFFEDYDYYGKPQLVFVSEVYGFDWPAHDDGIWTTDEMGPGISEAKRTSLIDSMKAKAASLKSEEA